MSIRTSRARATWRSLGVVAVAATMSLGLGLGVVAGQTAGWAPSPFATGDNTFDGAIDSPSAGSTVAGGGPIQVNGWVVDKTAEGWAGIDRVQVWVGTAFEGGRQLAEAPSGSFAQFRQDLLALGNPFWASSAYRMTIPANSLAAGSQTLTVYAHTPNKGWWMKQVQVNVSGGGGGTTATTGTVPAGSLTFKDDPLAFILSPGANDDDEPSRDAGDFLIKGYALDRNATTGTGIEYVDLYIDGDRNTGKSLGKASIDQDYGSGAQFGAQFTNSGFGKTINAHDYDVGNHQVFAYVKSKVSGREVVVTKTFRIRP